MKPIITLFTAVLLSQAIMAQTTLIPDANFEQALIDQGYDTGTPDGSVPTANISGVTNLYITWENISDLTGIEDFAALTILACDNNPINFLDLSNNTGLIELRCGNNQLTSLDVSNNTALTWLNCTGNNFTSLDISNNTALTILGCGNNQLTSLDVSNNTALTSLDCGGNQLTSLDVSNSTALWYLACDSNQLTSLDISNNTALWYLACDSNQLTWLNLKNGNNTNMGGMSAYDNPNLTCIEVDDTSYSNANWVGNNFDFDSQTSFSEDCNNPCSSSTTGMPEYGLSFNLYPNPTTSIVTVDGIKGTFELFNILGKLMQTSKTNTIDLTQLARGIYLLKATDEQGSVYSQKIIKE